MITQDVNQSPENKMSLPWPNLREKSLGAVSVRVATVARLEEYWFVLSSVIKLHGAFASLRLDV